MSLEEYARAVNFRAFLGALAPRIESVDWRERPAFVQTIEPLFDYFSYRERWTIREHIKQFLNDDDDPGANEYAVEPMSDDEDVMEVDSDPEDECFTENGRRYGKFRRGSYLQPCDEKECDRLDIMHTLFKTVRSKTHRLTNTPFQEQKPGATGMKASRILDLGCGTGIWLMDMAERYKHTECVGLDMHSMAPDTLLPNVDIRVPFDYESPWMLGERSWDLIHLQMARGSIQSWPKVYEKIIRHLKPGTGWFESVEVDFTPRCVGVATVNPDEDPEEKTEGVVPEGYLKEWWRLVCHAYGGAGRPIILDKDAETRGMLAQCGFVDIQHTKYRLPLNAWPSEADEKTQHRAGNWYNIAMCRGEKEGDRWNGGMGFEAIALAPTCRAFGWDKKTARIPIKGAMVQSSDTSLQVYNILHVWTARAPNPNEPRAQAKE